MTTPQGAIMPLAADIDLTMPLPALLEQHGACGDARRWAASYPTAAAAWDACQRPDWMFWALDKINYQNDRALRLFACWCVRQVWHLLDDDRSRHAVEVAERYANGEATDEELAAAWAAASAAAGAAAWDAASAATWDAARDAASDAAWDAASAAAWDAAWDAARAAAWAAASAAAGAAAWDAAGAAAWDAARAAQAAKLRELIGNPFTPETQHPALRTQD